MVRKISPAQLRSQLRQAQQKQRQAVSKYNAAVRKLDRDRKRAVDEYNREVRAHNARVRTNRQRLRSELSRLSAASTASPARVTYRTSVSTLRRSFARIEQAAEAGTWHGGDLLDLAEAETANSVAALNALLAQPDQRDVDDAEVASLQLTSITDELSVLSADLDARWQGALFALHPRNPDAARHFCTSSREILDTILISAASDDEVEAGRPDFERTPDGGVSRRARIRFCLDRRGEYDADLEVFVDDDVDDVVALFREFNAGAHGEAGRFDIGQLAALKTRVEGAVRFLHRVVWG